MKLYTQCAHLTAQPGKQAELIQLLQESSKLLTNVPECLYYLIGLGQEPDTVCISELWTSKDAKDAFGARPEVIKQLQNTFMPLVASIDKPITATIVSGAGTLGKELESN